MGWKRHETDIQQLNLIMELLGKPSEEFMDKISSDSVNLKKRTCASFLFYFLFCSLLAGSIFLIFHTDCFTRSLALAYLTVSCLLLARSVFIGFHSFSQSGSRRRPHVTANYGERFLWRIPASFASINTSSAVSNQVHNCGFVS